MEIVEASKLTVTFTSNWIEIISQKRLCLSKLHILFTWKGLFTRAITDFFGLVGITIGKTSVGLLFLKITAVGCERHLMC